MPRGDNPNSRANLTNRFNEQTARKAQKKSAKSRKLNGNFREAAKLALDDATLTEMIEAMIEQAVKGNVTAFKALYDIRGEANEPAAEADYPRIIIAARLDEPEQPEGITEY